MCYCSVKTSAQDIFMTEMYYFKNFLKIVCDIVWVFTQLAGVREKVLDDSN